MGIEFDNWEIDRAGRENIQSGEEFDVWEEEIFGLITGEDNLTCSGRNRWWLRELNWKKRGEFSRISLIYFVFAAFFLTIQEDRVLPQYKAQSDLETKSIHYRSLNRILIFHRFVIFVWWLDWKKWAQRTYLYKKVSLPTRPKYGNTLCSLIIFAVGLFGKK